YAALAELRLPPEVRFAAGIVHEGRELDELRRLRNRIETLVGRPVDVAAACGLGRRDRERAVRNLAWSQALAERPAIDQEWRSAGSVPSRSFTIASVGSTVGRPKTRRKARAMGATNRTCGVAEA